MAEVALLCVEQGKEKVLSALERQHTVLEDYQAVLFAEPETVRQAERLSQRLIRQDLALAELRRLSVDEMRARLAQDGFLP